MDKEIDEQILDSVYGFYEEIDLGFCKEAQKFLLMSNTLKLMKLLCYVENYGGCCCVKNIPIFPMEGKITYVYLLLLSTFT